MQREVVHLRELFDSLYDLLHSFWASVSGYINDAMVQNRGRVRFEDEQSRNIIELKKLECFWNGLGGILQIDLCEEDRCIGIGRFRLWMIVKPRGHYGVVFRLQFETQRTTNFGCCGGKQSDYIGIFVRRR